MAGDLKIRAESAEDMAVIAACLQDSIIAVGDIAFIPGRRSFAAMISRFKWEDDAREKKNRRILCGLHFDSVLEVQSQNIPQSDPRHILDLLTIGCEEHDDAEATITLVFANDGVIRLKVECVDVYLRDFGEAWSTPRKPKHPVAGPGI